MFAKEIYIRRRSALCGKMGSGLILIPGNMLTPNNYLNNAYYFRQDSSFLYYFGLNTPALVGLIDADSGEVALYGDDFTVEDIIWTGPQPSLREQGAEAGVSNSFPLADLKTHLTKAIVQGRRIHYLPPYRGETKLLLADLLGLKPGALHDHKSVELMMAVAEMREKKGPEEIEELEKSFHIGYAMHTTAMKMCRPGIVEREIAGTIEGISKAFGRGVSFPPIVSQHGETLHNLHSDGVLQNGRLLLCDAGAEGLSYYCSDHTRTYPVSGKFTQKQKDIYNIVLAAHDRVAAMIAPHMPYMDIHNASYRILAEGLISLGLMRGTAEDAVAAGAMTLFMPHGLGHMMGIDVHDMEDLGQCYVGYDDETRPSDQFGLASLRMGRRLQEGFVITDEPGCYFIPALIDKWRAENINSEFLNFDAIDKFKDFGGIRLEDDILITPEGSRFTGEKHIPITIEEVEKIMNE